MVVTGKQIVAFFVGIILVLFSLQIENYIIIGALIILVNVYFCFKARNNKLLFVLSFLLTFINNSVAFYDLILNHINAPLWQRNGLLNSQYDMQTAKSILITSIIVACIVVPKINKLPNILQSLKRKNNDAISCGLAICLSILIVFGYFTEIRGRTGYSSVANPVFEYSSILLVIFWYYSGRHPKISFWFTNIYAVLYLGMFLSIGDRSSVAIILVTVFLLNFAGKLATWKFIVGAVAIIFVFNMIGYGRSHAGLSLSSLILFSMTRGLYVDTISWSYYASTTITALFTYVENAWKFIPGNLLYFVTGISTKYSNMSKYGPRYIRDLYNAGGGLYPSYFYGMAGYVGVIVGAIILGCIIVSFFKQKRDVQGVYAILITVLAFRWYLYSISTLFRGVFVLASLALLFCQIVISVTAN